MESNAFNVLIVEKLKPCPFCGGKGILHEGLGEFWIICHNINCRASTRMDSVKENAKKVWNNRTEG